MSLAMEATSHMGVLPTQQQIEQQQSSSHTPSPQPNVEPSNSAQNDITANLSAILNAAKSNSVNLVSSEQSPSPGNESTTFEKELEAQQKAFQRFTSSLNDLGFRSPFPVNVLPPFLAALQQNPLSLHQQLMGISGSRSSGVSPGFDEEEDAENLGSTEPEDLTVGYRKEKKENTDDNADSEASTQQNWSYEEQFKQLYELSDDVKRKEWLDDWLGFMHRIGKPVTRIPIMAKQVLDLYELYRLVVQHGGLVEIINKKLWREITKGLNLPSSITSAAFTLRTQYQKFLYDYECEREGLSCPADLQQAIDGNRREGRRNTSNASSFTPMGYSIAHHNTNTLLSKHLNGSLGLRNGIDEESGLGPSASQQAALVAAYRAEQLAALEVQQRQFERAQRAAVEAVTRQTLHASASGRESTSSVDSDICPAKRARTSSGATTTAVEESSCNSSTNAATERLFGAVPSAHLKVTSREGRGSENSLVVSMEINGTMYQGVLFALPDSLAQSNVSVDNA
uniref:Uncharacterized protein n=1 Tax=Parascaris univalens TaxID=6257 RepID=A0A915AAX4_PARUN